MGIITHHLLSQTDTLILTAQRQTHTGTQADAHMHMDIHVGLHMEEEEIWVFVCVGGVMCVIWAVYGRESGGCVEEG